MPAKLLPPFGAFLQSRSWEEMERSLGKTVRRIELVEGENRLSALAIEESLPLIGVIAYLPKGPVFSGDTAWAAKALKTACAHTNLIVAEPMIPLPGMRPAKMWQPSHTLIVPLDQSDDERLAKMHSKTRYNIRLAAKKGVTVRLVSVAEGFDAFFALLKETAKRDHFFLHPEARYRAQAQMHTDAVARIALAEYQGKTLAAGLWIDLEGTRTYLHGASSTEHRDLMAPYALHDFMMRDAASRGLKQYDFWGIAPTGSKNHPLAGVTRFKEGFGGERFAMPGTFELPLAPARYALFVLLRRVRGLARR